MIELIGYIGSLLLAACGIPQVYKSFKDKHSNGLHLWFILMWLVGEYTTLAYILLKGINSIPLLINYIISVVTTTIIMYYKIR